MKVMKNAFIKGINMFEKYVMIIRKRAHEYSKKYHIDYSELESQGFLIYCECLQNYDVSKSNFCTYLYIQLGRLNDFAKTYIRQKGFLIQDYYNKPALDDKIDFEENIQSIEYDLISCDDLLEIAKDELSSEAYELLVWILKREWEKDRKKKDRKIPNISSASRYFNKNRKFMEKIWDECKNFWSTEGLMLYV